MRDEILNVIKQASESENHKYLALTHQGLSEVPLDLLAIKHLEQLDLSHNQLTVLPAEIGKLSNLKELNLASNKITDLPVEISELSRLRALHITDNPLRFPPPEIVNQGTKALLRFLKSQLRPGSRRRIWSSKLLLVGEGGVGKTNLLRNIRGEPFVEGLETTHGIEVSSLSLPHPTEKKVRMRLKTWDFGGQEIYHATHQFFLTNRSLFLLLWNSRLGYEQGKLAYWLDAIKARAPESPVMIVATHIDQRDAELPLVDIKRSYPQIQGAWKISNKTGDGMQDLVQAIAVILADPGLMPLMGETWPVNWFQAAEAIRRIPKNYTTPNFINRLLSRFDVTGASAKSLRRWLHELGDILDFQDDEELRDIVILKPQWVTRHISDVLESREVMRSSGWFPRSAMDQIWSPFNHGLQQHLLRLMEKFDLSYRTLDNNEVSIVVECLSPDENIAYQKPWDQAALDWPGREIRMQFKLDGNIPAGVPTWFIARTHRFTMDIHWRYGVLLTDKRKPFHLALVQAFPFKRLIQLTVRGPAPHDFFTLLRDGLELILDRFPGLGITRLIPCPGHNNKPCTHLFDFKLLEKRLVQEPPRYKVECPVSFQELDLRRLLFGLTSATGDEVLAKLDKLISMKGESSDEHSIEMGALAELHIRQYFLKTMRLIQHHLEASCPCVFTLRSNNRAQWLKALVGDHLQLQLYCEEPGCWHTVGDPYNIDRPAFWLRKIEPYIRHLVKVVRYVPIAGRTLSLMSDNYGELFKEDFEFVQALVGRLPKDESDADIRYIQNEIDQPFIKRAEHSALRALEELLTKLDRSRRWRDLQSIVTPEGHCLWLCKEHAQKYSR